MQQPAPAKVELYQISHSMVLMWHLEGASNTCRESELSWIHLKLPAWICMLAVANLPKGGRDATLCLISLWNLVITTVPL